MFVYEQGYPAYKRDFFDITTLIDTGANKIQISLGVFKFQNFTDCSFVTPAPYFDNVALSLFRRAGPEVYLFRNNRRGLARSGFPASGTLDLEDPASHSVCFDSALGDSVVVRVGVLRDGAQLAGPPELHWQLKKNPIYDPYRQLPPPNPVLGDSVRPPHLGDGQRGILYAFDLPDAGFLFPGDVLHYYIRAVDDAAGDLGVATLPADTTGYSIFPSDAAYLADLFPLDFEVRALPSVHDLTTGDQPRILVWLHTVSQEEIDEWVVALANLGYRHGVDIDFFRSPYPAPLQATAGQMIGYEVLLYSSGKNVTRSLSFQELLNLQDWFALGGKKALFAGDNFVSGVRQESITFPREYLGLDIETGAAGSNVRPQIDDQVRPLVLPMAGNPLDLTIEFLADGGCYYNLFDAITPYGTGERVLEFTAPGGGPGGYTPAAGIYQYRVVDDAHTLTLPYGFAFIGTPLGQKDGALAARTRFLAEVMTFFGAPATGPPTDLPAQEGFTVRFYPNPFNPRVQVEYDMPRRGRLSLHIYNLRGELVRTLIDEVVPPGPGRLIWDATDTEGRTAAAGVYFLAIKAPGLREVRKMALIK